MCGILVSSGLKQPFTHRQLRSLRRRGPDEIGYWTNADVQIAHARLSIIGLDERATEPLENATHVLAYNGEIYNFNDIKRRLEAKRIQVSGANDAEVLLHAWAEWGPAILTELVGFWAFAIYDKQRRVVTLARDQFGVKPLYYYRDGERFCAASMIGTIQENVPQARDLDFTAISEYCRYQFTFGDKTFLKQIRKVLPGHLVEIDLNTNELTTTRYEDILATNGERVPITPKWIEETRSLLMDCVLASTISDTPFTTFCSGGIDSSLITRIAQPEIAYHCNFSDPDCNETFYAKQVVEGHPQRLFVVNAEEEFDLVQKLKGIVEDFDELTIGSVILPLEDLLAQVKRRYKVVLTGTGGDELFAGYVRYQLVLGQCYQDSYRGLYERMQGVEGTSRRFEMTHSKGDPELYQFYDPSVEQTFHSAFEECQRDSTDLEAMLRFDRRYFLGGLLNIDDKMCGRHSLESRPSFLDQRLVRRMNGADASMLLRNGELKPVLRDIGEGLLPKSVLYRTDKMGFTTPIGSFVNKSSGLIREQITDSPFRDLYDLRGMKLTADSKFSREVFGLLMLDLWLNRYACK